MTKEIQIPSRDIAIQISDDLYKPIIKRPTLSVRTGNESTKVATFSNMDSALYFFDFCCDMFHVRSE